MAQSPEQNKPDASVQQMLNQAIRLAQQQQVSALGETVVLPGEPLVESKLKDNSFLLLAGQHEGLLLTVTGTTLRGQPGTEITRLATLTGLYQEISGVRFSTVAGSNNLTQLVRLTNPNGRYRFIGCRFTKAVNNPFTHVELANGARVVFESCTFDGLCATVGSVVNVLSANPADCSVIGCVNLTGNLYGAVTNLGSI